MRSRPRLVEAAHDLFLAGEGPIALDSVAKAAGVAIGTLYRHFSTREALTSAVYRSELDALEEEADALLAVQPAVDALRQWMDEYARFVSTKYAMHGTLRIALTPVSTGISETRRRIGEAVPTSLPPARLTAAYEPTLTRTTSHWRLPPWCWRGPPHRSRDRRSDCCIC